MRLLVSLGHRAAEVFDEFASFLEVLQLLLVLGAHVRRAVRIVRCAHHSQQPLHYSTGALKSNLVHFSLKIWYLVAKNYTNFPQNQFTFLDLLLRYWNNARYLWDERRRRRAPTLTHWGTDISVWSFRPPSLPWWLPRRRSAPGSRASVACWPRSVHASEAAYEAASSRRTVLASCIVQTSDVTNHSLVVDPSIAPPGFDLRRRWWSTLNHHFRTGQGRYAANLVRWNQTSDPSCSCGASLQTMLHIVNDCPDMKFPGGLPALHLAEEEAIAWLGMQSTR